MFEELTKNFDLEDLLSKILRGGSKAHYLVMNQALSFMVPFNNPHKFKVVRIDDEHVRVSAPYRRSNLNHLKGMHACAIATLGEICAGLSILRDFGFKKYRFILSNLQVDYSYQGKTSLIGVAQLPSSLKDQVISELQSNGKTQIKLVTNIHDENNNHVAMVTSTWQLKDWKNVKTKLRETN